MAVKARKFYELKVKEKTTSLNGSNTCKRMEGGWRRAIQISRTVAASELPVVG
jgi:hypothetical protein